MRARLPQSGKLLEPKGPNILDGGCALGGHVQIGADEKCRVPGPATSFYTRDEGAYARRSTH